jgi:hypothetical protein
MGRTGERASATPLSRKISASPSLIRLSRTQLVAARISGACAGRDGTPRVHYRLAIARNQGWQKVTDIPMLPRENWDLSFHAHLPSVTTNGFVPYASAFVGHDHYPM